MPLILSDLIFKIIYSIGYIIWPILYGLYDIYIKYFKEIDIDLNDPKTEEAAIKIQSAFR